MTVRSVDELLLLCEEEKEFIENSPLRNWKQATLLIGQVCDHIDRGQINEAKTKALECFDMMRNGGKELTNLPTSIEYLMASVCATVLSQRSPQTPIYAMSAFAGPTPNIDEMEMDPPTLGGYRPPVASLLVDNPTLVKPLLDEKQAEVCVSLSTNLFQNTM